MAVRDDYMVEDYRDRRGFNWAWLLLIPLFFIVGWFANDALTNNGATGPGMQFGVGGGPGNTIVSPTTIDTVTPTQIPTVTPTVTPVITTTPQVTGSGL